MLEKNGLENEVEDDMDVVDRTTQLSDTSLSTEHTKLLSAVS